MKKNKTHFHYGDHHEDLTNKSLLIKILGFIGKTVFTLLTLNYIFVIIISILFCLSIFIPQNGQGLIWLNELLK